MKAKPKILIVEDEKITAEDIQRTLKHLGYNVSSIVSSGNKAIEEVKENRPDLILMDIKLRGDINGIEASEKIRARFDIPIVYITGLAEEAALERAKGTEPFGYIHKPLEEKDLYTTIDMALYRHKMERELKESEERFRQFFENEPEYCYMISPEEIILDANKTALEVLGYKKNELIGKPLITIYAAESIQKMKQLFTKWKKTGKLRNEEMIIVSRQGNKRTVLLSAATVKDMEGRVLHSVLIQRDITERKQAEKEKEKFQAQLIHSEKMAGIGTLAGGIAHEFNNLLQIMRGHAEFAQKTKRPEDIEEAFETVIYSADKAVKIIRDLLTFSTQEVSEGEPCDITALIESVLLLTEKHFKKHNIKVVKKYGRTPKIEVNKGEIQQVFLNMIMNSRDAILPGGGKLEIRVKKAKENIEVSISDTGKGIEKEDLSKVFEPFYTTKEAVGRSGILGVGLGLSVSYGIVKRHGGMIKVESEKGKGTTFTIKLPVKGGESQRGIAEDQKKEIKTEGFQV